MTLSMTDDASDDAFCSSIGAAADPPAVHVVDSNTSTASEFAQANAASSIDRASANVERAPPSSEPASLHLPPSGMLSSNSGVEVVANYRHQQYQEHLYMQQMQYIPGMHMPMTTVMPSLSTSPTQQWKHDDRPAFAATPLPTQATPTFGVGMMLGMLGGGAHSMPQSGRPSASSSSKLAVVSFAAIELFALSVAFCCILITDVMFHNTCHVDLITTAGTGRPIRFSFA